MISPAALMGGGLFLRLKLCYPAVMGWTFQSLINGRMTVTAYCHNARCHHHQRLDLKALSESMGPDAPAMADDLIPKLRCGKCGGKKVDLIYSPKGNETMYPRQGYAN